MLAVLSLGCVALAGGAALLAGRAGHDGRWDTLRLAGGDPSDLDPALVRDVTSAEYVYEVYSGLVTLSPDADVVPDLAESWAVSDSGTVYTFTLRADARFHDGRSVVADDLAYAIERACSPETASPVAETYLGDIVGCTDKLAGRAASVAGVQVLGTDRIALTIDEPKSYFLSKLTYPTSFAIDRAQVEARGDWWRRPNATGPFRLARYENGTRLRLERNDLYYGSRARLAAVEFDLRPIDPITRYENGELDAVPVGPSDHERLTDPFNPLRYELLEGPGTLQVTYLGLNTRVPPFDDPDVRRALAQAIDRRRLVDVVLEGVPPPATTILPPGMPGHDPDANPLAFDPAGARSALRASTYGGADGLPPLTLHVTGEAGDSPVAEAVADFLSEVLGIADVAVEQAPWATFQSELDAGRYGMFLLGWSADYPDPQDFLDVLFHSGSPLNETGYAEPEVDALLEQARLERDEAARLALYRQAERRILADAPWVPLFHGRDTWLVAPHVRGLALPAIVRPRLADVWIE